MVNIKLTALPNDKHDKSIHFDTNGYHTLVCWTWIGDTYPWMGDICPWMGDTYLYGVMYTINTSSLIHQTKKRMSKLGHVSPFIRYTYNIQYDI